jgi:hypothetical protein
MAKLTYNPDGTANLNFEKIQKISIDNIVQVISHRVMRTEEFTVHEIEFVNEGRCQLSYTTSGQLVNLTTNNLTTEINLEHDILVLKVP